MKLWLMRHAHAEPWSADYLSDQERLLSARGRLDCTKLHEWFQQYPEHQARTILVSPAQRTQETAQRVLQGLKWAAMTLCDPLWAASQDELKRLITLHADSPGPLMLIGHNPGLSELLAWLTDSSFGNMSPGTLVMLDVTLPLHAGSGEIELSVQPSDLI
jgi:phosphohistidine phosphatase